MKEFDLNIEKILEDWEVYHAVREIIANALDEQVLTRTKEISIYKINDCWHIVDYGRGLNYHHLTQNESEEKIHNDKLIGRFGVGLKDALATFYRHGVVVSILSKYGKITLKQTAKSGFDDIITLHAQIEDSPDKNMIGTDFCLTGCADEEITKAKRLFLNFSNPEVLETTIYGQVIKKSHSFADIYINGVKVAEEENFLFSYNITALNAQIKRALNRERTNVGRTAYTSRVKEILLKCTSNEVISAITDDLKLFGAGKKHDELTWNDIMLHASVQLNKNNEKATFVTQDQLEETPSLIDEIKSKGFETVVVPTSLMEKMADYNEGASLGQKIRTSYVYNEEESKSFVPKSINVDSLDSHELFVYNKKNAILKLIGGQPYIVKKIEIVEKLYESAFFDSTVCGLWVPDDQRILIKRTQLQSIKSFADTLLHECAHAVSGADDVSRPFEIQLSDYLGIVAEKAIKEIEKNAIIQSDETNNTNNGNVQTSNSYKKPDIKSAKKSFFDRIKDMFSDN